MDERLKALKIDRRSGGSRWSLLNTTLIALVVLLGVLVVFFWQRSRPERTAGEAEPVTLRADGPSEALEPEAGSGRQDVLVVPGYVVAHHRISLGSKVIGRVAWMGVEKGDQVEEGQLLVKLEDSEFRAQLDQAEAELTAAEARLNQLETGSRPEEIERGRAELRRARADLVNAKSEFERLFGLYSEGVVSRQEVDNAQARYEMAEAAVEVAEKNLRLLDLGPRAEEVERARADVEAARAARNYFQSRFEATEIRAPVTGTVLARIAEVGEMITTSFAGEAGAKSAVVSLADLNDLQVEIDVSQSDFKRIDAGQGCELRPEAFPDRVYRCAIDEISPEANRQKATIQVKVKILSPDPYLRPEMSATVTFFREEKDEPAVN